MPLCSDILIPTVRANEQAKAQNAEQLSDLELTGQMTYVFLFDFVIRYRRRLTESSPHLYVKIGSSICVLIRPIGC